MPTQDRKHQSEINVDVFIHGCEVARVTTVGVTAVEQHKFCIGVRLDDWSHVDWRGRREDEIWVTDTSVKLNWMRVFFRSDIS